MIRFSQATAFIVAMAVTAAAVQAAAPNVQLKLSGAIVSSAGGREVDAPMNRAVHAGEILRYTILARNVGGAPAYQLAPIGKIPQRTQFLKLAAAPKYATVSYSSDGTHWLPFVKTGGRIAAIRWSMSQPLAPRSSATFAYEVRVK